MPPAREYFAITLLGVPFLAWAMMSNHIIRTEGFPKIAMFTLIIPAIINLILDPLLIIVFDMGMAGAAWATVVSYVFSAAFTTHFFVRGKSKMRLQWVYLKIDLPIIKDPPGTKVIPYGFSGCHFPPVTPTNSPLSPDLPQPITSVNIAANAINFFI